MDSLHFRMKRQLRSPFSSSIFSKPSVSAAKLSSDETTTSFNSIDPNAAGLVLEIIANLRNLGFKNFIDGKDSKILILRLRHCRFKHSPFGSFVFAYVLAAKRKFKELRLVLEQILQEQGFMSFLLGSGSAPSLCELLWHGFRSFSQTERYGICWLLFIQGQVWLMMLFMLLPR